jgi:hypothetical protein
MKRTKLFSDEDKTPELKSLSNSIFKARQALNRLSEDYPVYQKIWNIVDRKLNIMVSTLNNNSIPTPEEKNNAHLSLMLARECDAIYLDKNNEVNQDLITLYNIDYEYQSLNAEPNPKKSMR